LDAAVKTVEQQLAAKSPVSGRWGFDNHGDFITWANIDYDLDKLPNCVFEIHHELLDFKGEGWSRELWMCWIMATDGETCHLTSGLVDNDKYHSLQAKDDVISVAEAVERFAEADEADAQPRCNQLH
jgi:hypothetical protein